jgi:hypothetical protein
MATTTNYGWTTPDDTDLVKDGAAAIRTLGSSVDTTTKALNPETTTGDIAYRSATANTNTRLALGAAGQVLTVNSGATAPEWAAPASGSTFAGCLLTNSADITLSNNTTTTLTWNQEDFDTDGFHSTSTNTSRITIPAGKAGKYLVTSKVQYASNSNGRRITQIIKNGSNLWDFESASPGSTNLQLQGVAIIDLAEGDYVETTAWQNSGGSLGVSNANTRYSAFAAFLIGA